MNTVQLFYRKSTPGAYSISQIFQLLSIQIQDHLLIQSVELPYINSGISNLLANIRFAGKAAIDQINHITGDAHYIVLGISRGRTVLTIHDCVILSRTSRWHPKFWIYKWFWYDLPIWKSHIVTTISDKSKSEIIAYTGCSPEKIRVIPNFVPSEFQPVLRPFNTACPRILHIGITENKNLERLIPALAGIPCILEIIGELSMSQRQLLDQHQIRFESRQNLSLEAMVERYEAADFLVFVSTYEGFGMPIIEAQATGRPVVTSRLEPMISVAGPDGACFVDPFDVMDIRAGLERVIQDGNYRNTLIQNGIKNVQRFTLDAVAQQYLELYKSLFSAFEHSGQPGGNVD